VYRNHQCVRAWCGCGVQATANNGTTSAWVGRRRSGASNRAPPTPGRLGQPVWAGRGRCGCWQRRAVRTDIRWLPRQRSGMGMRMGKGWLAPTPDDAASFTGTRSFVLNNDELLAVSALRRCTGCNTVDGRKYRPPGGSPHNPIWSRLQANDSFQNLPRLVGRLGSEE